MLYIKHQYIGKEYSFNTTFDLAVLDQTLAIYVMQGPCCWCMLQACPAAIGRIRSRWTRMQVQRVSCDHDVKPPRCLLPWWWCLLYATFQFTCSPSWGTYAQQIALRSQNRLVIRRDLITRVNFVCTMSASKIRYPSAFTFNSTPRAGEKKIVCFKKFYPNERRILRCGRAEFISCGLSRTLWL